MSEPENNLENVKESFELYKKYNLKYPYVRGDKTIKQLKIEVPNGKQLLALEGKESNYEIIAAIVSMCSVGDKFTEQEVLEFKAPDLNALGEVLADFLL